MRQAMVIAVLGASLLVACQRQEAPSQAAAPAAPQAAAPLVGFSSQAGFDAAGYYLPIDPVQVGNFKLAHISVGAPSDFSQWQDGKREGVFGPIIFQFWDITSPTQVNELGQEGYARQASIKPTAYVFEPGRFEFIGTDPQLGEVSFKGVFDLKTLAAVKDEPDEKQAVLSGTLRVGDQTNANVRFGFWVGD